MCQCDKIRYASDIGSRDIQNAAMSILMIPVIDAIVRDNFMELENQFTSVYVQHAVNLDFVA